jgi:hypothetical protein
LFAAEAEIDRKHASVAMAAVDIRAAFERAESALNGLFLRNAAMVWNVDVVIWFRRTGERREL